MSKPHSLSEYTININRFPGFAQYFCGRFSRRFFAKAQGMKKHYLQFRSWSTTTTAGKRTGVVLLLAASLGIIWFLAPVLPLGDDWRLTFSQLNFWKPFEHQGIGYGVRNPPWILLLLPYAWLPAHLGNAINFLLNILVSIAVIHRLRGGYWALGLVFLSPFFFQLMATNNIDWIPLAAFLAPESLGIVLLSCKPQAVAGAALIWIHQAWRSGPIRLALLFLPLAVLAAASLFLWPNWPIDLLNVQRAFPQTSSINWSIFPFAIPLGIWLLWRAWRTDDPFLAAIATPCLVTYISPYSFTVTFVLLACRHRREAMLIWLCAWWITIIGMRV
jgi:hypothetical protein